MNDLFLIINQYQRGYEDVLNRLVYFRQGSLCFKNKELNKLFKQYSARTLSEQKEADFLHTLQSVFSCLPLSQFQTHHKILIFIKEQLSQSL